MSVQLESGLLEAAGPERAWRRPGLGLRLLGALLACLSLLPLYRLLDRPETGLAGRATVRIAALNAELLWTGFALLAGLALAASILVRPERFERWSRRVAGGLGGTPLRAWSAAAALVAFGAASAFSLVVLGGQPNLIDSMSQLLHARFMAAGRIAGPDAGLGAFWTMQQSLFTPRGWVSQYPPGHVLALAAGLRAGAAWMVGPLALALGVALLFPVAERLLPGARATARTGAALLAISPFALAQAGSYSSHTTALALGVAAVYCALRAERHATAWALAAGALLGAMFATRPLSAAAVGVAMAVFLPCERAAPRWRLRRVAALAAGAAPILAGLALYNVYLFGSPVRWGYQAALGPAAGPGFGIDPWGNAYGIIEAIGYVSAELGALSLNLLETPVPVVAVIAAFLLTAPRLAPGERFLVAWALLPLGAHLGYWHHGLFMGPRMLNELAPAWCLLGTRAAVAVTNRLPEGVSLGTVSPRVAAAALFVFALAAGSLYLAPERLWSYRQAPAAPAVARAAAEPAIIFVHGGWTSRLAMRLAAGGMRLDSVETALRQNPTCAVQAWADAKQNGAPAPALDFVPRATSLPATLELSPGNRIRVIEGAPLPPACAAEARADRSGVLDVSPLVWLGDLPPGEGQGTLFVRDLGPAENARLLATQPGRAAYVMMMPAPDARPELVPYEAGMARLWGGA